MVYTCYDMLSDCRSGRAEGWAYFVANYTPVIRKLVSHYQPEESGDSVVEGFLIALQKSPASLFQSLEPTPERWFVAELRQQVLGFLEAPEGAGKPDSTLDLELLSTALEPLTVVEKQAAWFETMHYAPPETGTLLRMDPRTVEKIRDKAGELIRGKVDTWRRTLLAENGSALGRAAAASHTPECHLPKAFLDVLDGRTTWQRREEMDRHVSACWHCIDHFCRMAEVIELLRGIDPLPAADAAKFQAALGLQPQKKTLWRRWFATS